MATTVSAYQSAVTELLSAKSAVDTLVDTIRKGSDALREWRTTNIIAPNYDWPQNEQSRRTQTLNTAQWPTGPTIADALSSYHSKRATLVSLWNGLPETDRVALHSPDKLS